MGKSLPGRIETIYHNVGKDQLRLFRYVSFHEILKITIFTKQIEAKTLFRNPLKKVDFKEARFLRVINRIAQNSICSVPLAKGEAEEDFSKKIEIKKFEGGF